MRRGTTLAIIVPVYNEQYLVESSLTRLALQKRLDDIGRAQPPISDPRPG